MSGKPPEARAKALMRAQSSRQLVRALLSLAAKPAPSPEEKLTKAWLCGELESRYPQVDAALDAWIADDGPLGELSYAEVLVSALPPAAVAA